jgi:hypothetical protein
MSKTVLVLGAGASAEVGLPIGSVLTRTIRSLLDLRTEAGRLVSGDELLLQALRLSVKTRAWPGQPETLQAVARGIAAGMLPAASIDNYVHAHRGRPEIVLCAKLAIARAILAAEGGSRLAFTQDEFTFDYESVHTTWYAKFAQLLREDCSFTDLPARFSHVGAVIFNYDRCFEHFLAHDLSVYYGVPIEEAEGLVDQIEIYHPYGTVGDLPRRALRVTGVPFGVEPQARELLDISGKLKTFTEGTDPGESSVVCLRRMIHDANRFIFLGFSFARQNMRLLMPERADPHQPGQRACFATAYGESDSNRLRIRDELVTWGGFDASAMRLAQRTCSELIDDHRRWLSFA